MRLLLFILTALCATASIARAQDCTTVAADQTMHLQPVDSFGTVLYEAITQSSGANYGTGHPGCDRFVVDFVGNAGMHGYIDAWVNLSTTTQMECDQTVLKATAWGWHPPEWIEVKGMIHFVPGRWVQLADQTWSGIGQWTPHSNLGIDCGFGNIVASFSNSPFPYDLVRVALSAEEQSQRVRVDVEDIAARQ